MFTMNDIAAMPHYSMSHLSMDLQLFSMLNRGESAQYREIVIHFLSRMQMNTIQSKELSLQKSF